MQVRESARYKKLIPTSDVGIKYVKVALSLFLTTNLPSPHIPSLGPNKISLYVNFPKLLQLPGQNQLLLILKSESDSLL